MTPMARGIENISNPTRAVRCSPILGEEKPESAVPTPVAAREAESRYPTPEFEMENALSSVGTSVPIANLKIE